MPKVLEVELTEAELCEAVEDWLDRSGDTGSLWGPLELQEMPVEAGDGQRFVFRVKDAP